MRRKRHDHEMLKGAASGAIAGLVASWTMNRFQAEWSKAARALEERSHHRLQGQSTGREQPSQANGDDATMRTAEWISEGVLHRPLSRSEKKKLGPVVHYSTGTLMGAAYGALTEFLPQATAADGALFGTVVFAGLDELGLWAFGLAGPPAEYPISTHAGALAAHWVYGVTTETVRKTLRHVW